MARPNQALLNLSALRHNVDVARSLAPRSKLMAVVKANGYGHGAVTVARGLEPVVDALAVACIEEAIELRDNGVAAPILLLEGVFEAKELVIAAELGLWVTIDNQWQLQWLEEARLPAALQCWLKIDTGMHRLGVAPDQVDPADVRVEIDADARPVEPRRNLFDMSRFAGAVIALHHDAAVVRKAGQNGAGGRRVKNIVFINRRHIIIRGRETRHFLVRIKTESLAHVQFDIRHMVFGQCMCSHFDFFSSFSNFW